MKILHCDFCHVEVNDYAHWYNDAQPRNMYELKCVHESGSDTYNGMIICHECIAKLLHKTESVTEFADRCRECGAKYGKLLKQKPCEDAVSRRAVYEILNDAYFLKLDEGAALQESVRQLPSVTPQQKIGRWIEHFDESGKWYECDQCHTDWGGSVNYCPNCGAKM